MATFWFTGLSSATRMSGDELVTVGGRVATAETAGRAETWDPSARSMVSWRRNSEMGLNSQRAMPSGRSWAFGMRSPWEVSRIIAGRPSSGAAQIWRASSSPSISGI